MTKKITLIMLVLLVVSAFVFVSCTQEAGGKPTPPKQKDPVVNELGDVGPNLVFNGDFESGDDYDVDGAEGASSEIVAGEGIDGSHALYVEQTATYGELTFDMTKYYARGKSYYVEAWFRDAGKEDGKTTDYMAKIDFSIVTGAGYQATGLTYDIPGQYDGDWLSDDDAAEIFEMTTNSPSIGVNLSDGKWHKVSGILDAENIEKTVVSEDEQNHATGESSMYLMSMVFYVGTYPNQGGYKYYIDNIVVKDLNTELDREGRTYDEPTEDDESEDEEGEGEGEGV